MGKAAGIRALGLGMRLALVLLTGCSVTGGNRLTLFPEGHRLIDSAKELRAAAPNPLPLPRELDKRLLPTYIVEPGDVLLVQPADLDSPARLPGDQPVLPDGSINLGRYGRLIAAGKTVDEIEADIRAVVEAQTKGAGAITVRIVTRVSKVYYVIGEVNAPGAFPLAGRETVLDGLMAAGGLTDRASRRNIILSRPTAPAGCRIVLPICYSEIVQLGDTSTNYQLAPGDRIYVATRDLCEDLLPACMQKPPCPPCGRPQTACAAQHHSCGADCFGAPCARLGQPVPAAAPAGEVLVPLPGGHR
jgi:protein involved in polysaccharide export with SLBB domain